MAAYASEARLLHTSWADRSVPFVPSDSESWREIGDHEWWFILVSPSHLIELHGRYYGESVIKHYVFMRPQKATSQPLDLIHEDKVQSEETQICEAELSEEPVKEKKPCLLDLYNIRGICRELEQEGRLPVDPERLERVCEIFEEIGGKDSKNLALTDHDSVDQLLATLKTK